MNTDESITMKTTQSAKNLSNSAPILVTLTKSPMKFFGLAALVCNSVFAVCAAFMKEAESFKYCIHMFLAVVGILIVTALWSPRALYHPSELEGLSAENMPKNKPWIPSIFIFGGMLIYMSYQLFKIQLTTGNP